MDKQATAETASYEALRAALISTAHAVGAHISDNCTDQFIVEGVPKEAALKIEQLKRRFNQAFPHDVRAIMEKMDEGDGPIYSAADLAQHARVPEKRVVEVRKALKALGLAKCGHLVTEDDFSVAGSGYFLTRQGVEVRNSFSSREAA